MNYPSLLSQRHRRVRFTDSRITIGLLLSAVLWISNISSEAGSATWELNPASDDWNTAANWTPATVPNGSTDIATFDLSNNPSVSVSSSVEVNGIIFDAPSPFTVTVTTNSFSGSLTISGFGIINESGLTQNFVTTAATPSGIISFSGSASAGDDVVFTNEGRGTAVGGGVFFNDTSLAATAVFINEGGGIDLEHQQPGYVIFFDDASADHGTFLCRGALKGGYGGTVAFFGSSTAANGAFTCEGAADKRASGGGVQFSDTATAGEGVFTFNGTDFEGAGGGFANFIASATAGNATLMANAGAVAGGTIAFGFGGATGGTARIEVFGNGSLSIGSHTAPGVTIGSLEGDGLVFLGPNNLTIGNNNLSTTFSGVIQDSGSLTKIGPGKLTLSGANTYTGGTIINAGTLYVTNKRTSSTSSGPVQVNSGKLGGTGLITGAVIVGDGIVPEAYLTPGLTNAQPAILTVRNTVTFQADGTFHFGYKSNGIGDKLVARGITINSGAELFFGPIDSGTIPVGTVFTVIDNRAVTAIAGTFSNIADGGTVTVGSNTFQANYEGGDGNDLTLTVVP